MSEKQPNATERRLPPPLSHTVFPILIQGCENDPEREIGVKNLLNAIIGGRNKFVIEKILSTAVEKTVPGRVDGDRVCRLDIVVQNQDGDICIIEIQLGYFTHIITRVLSYFARHRSANLLKGEFNYSMPRYAMVTIIDFALPLLRGEPYYHLYNTFSAENAPHLKLTESMQLHLVSLHRFREMEIEPHDDLTTWMHYFSQAYVNPEEVEELIEMNESLKGIEQTYRRAIQKPEVLDSYDYEQLLHEDYLMRVIEFKEEGREEGREHMAHEIALRMLARGAKLEDVAEDTGLTLAEVQKLLETSQG